MSMIIHFANMIFKPIINLGAAPMMMIVLTLIALCFKVKFSKALEGGIKLAIALTAIGSVIGVLTTQFQDALNAFVKSTGINLSVTDVGWAPLIFGTWHLSDCSASSAAQICLLQHYLLSLLGF